MYRDLPLLGISFGLFGGGGGTAKEERWENEEKLLSGEDGLLLEEPLLAVGTGIYVLPETMYWY